MEENSYTTSGSGVMAGKYFRLVKIGFFFVTEGAQIADDDQKQNCRATHVTFGSENRMSIPLPVTKLWRENTSGL
jgi:hypothetical protein